MVYYGNLTDILSLNIVASNDSLCVDKEHVLVFTTAFEKEMDNLNALLLWCVGSKWCSFPSVMEEYGLKFPGSVQQSLHAISFPDQDGRHSMHDTGSHIPTYVDGIFKPNCVNISLKLHKGMTLYELSNLVEKLNQYKQPFSKYNELVFFKDEGILFNKYLKDHLEPQELHQFSPESGFSASSMTLLQKETPEGTSMDTFVSGLEHASGLLCRVMSGTATFSEMTAGDEQMMKDLDIEREFAILQRYADHSGCDFSGKIGVRSMLELPQYTTHFENIKEVCEQYHMSACLEDPSFRELAKIIEESSSTDARAIMTPNEAKIKLDRVKEILFLTEKPNSMKILHIFVAMKNSAPFYQFVKEKNFHGEQGFMQQYRLITAQLQHEDYDEQILNQLKPAFKVVSPFINSDQNFNQLMREVTDLANPVENLMHLDTVNKNIMTIQKWFSRAEVSGT